ncbi:hypothetical protein MHM98_05345 [Psychrobium sp. MM17-31]|uniref:hypothetical protein n=1 Tax=Psychrobium sp. MM17-31 TaxID=2917758 RepID=UPI001EF41EAF|nr:hypothetical protein [Psychrobium sp. MM17-31]MCG7530781.1 hypothetical protein [Psychrobium sp. MM17-31]
MIKQLSFPLLFSAFLIGCGGSGSNSNSSSEPTPTPPPVQSVPLDTAFHGGWKIGDVVYTTISKGAINLYTYEADRSCYSSDVFTIDKSTKTSASLINVHTNEKSELKFAVDFDKLVIEEDGVALTFEEERFLNPVPGCENSQQIKSIEVDVELAYLPPKITLNRDAHSTGRVEYDYEIIFDINENGTHDIGDLAIRASHYKGEGHYPSNYQVSITRLGGDIWMRLPNHQAGTEFSTTGSEAHNYVNVTQNENTLTFKFDVTQNALLAHVNESTPIQVSGYMSYLEPESTVIDGWQDGPWNWSSEKHFDSLFEQDVFMPINSSGSLLLNDAESDWVYGESLWVDLKAVQFRFIK